MGQSDITVNIKPNKKKKKGAIKGRGQKYIFFLKKKKKKKVSYSIKSWQKI